MFDRKFATYFSTSTYHFRFIMIKAGFEFDDTIDLCTRCF